MVTKIGTEISELLTGTSAEDILSGKDGDDTLSGLGSDDIIYGNKGLDHLFGDSGDDTIFGGQNGGALSTGSSTDQPLALRDGVETLSGGSGDDAIYGNHGTDLIYGGGDADRLFGGQDDDTLFGGDGADSLFGNRGDDLFYGGAGNDVFIADRGNDVVGDFTLGQDYVLALSQRLATVDTTQGAKVTFEDGNSVTFAGFQASDITDAFFESPDPTASDPTTTDPTTTDPTTTSDSPVDTAPTSETFQADASGTAVNPTLTTVTGFDDGTDFIRISNSDFAGGGAPSFTTNPGTPLAGQFVATSDGVNTTVLYQNLNGEFAQIEILDFIGVPVSGVTNSAALGINDFIFA